MGVPFRIWLLVAASAASGLIVAAEPIMLDRATVIDRARHHAPELLAEQEQLGVALGHLRQARLWPYNPEVSLGGGPRRDDAGTTWDRSVEIRQRLPLSARRSAAVAVARADVSVTAAVIAERTRDVLIEAVQRHLAAIRDRERLRLATAAATVAERLREAIDQRHTAGEADDLAVNVAAIAVARAQAAVRQAEAESVASTASLAALLGIDPGAPITVLGDLAWPAPASADLAAAAERRPEYARLLAERASAEASARLAASRAGIDPGLSLEYAREEDADLVRLGLTVELPVADRGQGDRAAAVALARAAGRRLDAERLRITAEVTAVANRAAALQAAARSFAEAILPRLEANEQLASTALRAGSSSFSDVLSQQREVLAAREELLDLQHQAAVAAVEAAAAAAVLPFAPTTPGGDAQVRP